MATLRELLTAPPKGLLIRLADRFGGNWERYQVHPWDFRAPDPTRPYRPVSADDSLTALRSSGFRLRGCPSEIDNTKGRITSQNVVLGFIVQTTENNTEAQLLASEFQCEVDELIHGWSENCVPLHETITKIGGTISLSTRPGEGGVWNCIVVREFDIVYG